MCDSIYVSVYRREQIEELRDFLNAELQEEKPMLEIKAMEFYGDGVAEFTGTGKRRLEV